MISKIFAIPLILVAEMFVLRWFGVPSVELGMATLFVYFLLALAGAYFVRRTFGFAPPTGAFDPIILVLQFCGVALLVASSSFTTSTMNDGHFKPVGVLDFSLIGSVALLSTICVSVAMLCIAAAKRIGAGRL